MSVKLAQAVTAGHNTTSPLDEAEAVLAEYAVMSPAQRIVCAAWAASTWCYRNWGAHPRLYLNATQPGAGKSTVMNLVLAMSSEPLTCGYASAAALYGWIETHQSTSLGLDEADNAFGITGKKTSRAVLLSVINDGYSSAGKVLITRNGQSTRIPVYVPMALAGIGQLPGPLQARSLVIGLEPSVPKAVYFPEQHDEELAIVGQQLSTWLRRPATKRLLAATPDLAPVNGSPRFQQVCAPIYAIADAAGRGDEMIAALNEVRESMNRTPLDTTSLLLTDLREAWPAGATMLTSAQIIRLAQEHNAQRWGYLTQDRAGWLAVAALLRQKGIESKVRNGQRGYLSADLFA